MIKNSDRKYVRFFIKWKIWVPYSNMRLTWFKCRFKTQWLFDLIVDRQKKDDRHHAPCCPANHYHNARIVFSKCRCGAK